MNDEMKLCGIDRFLKVFVYRVEEGENLYRIAEKFHTTRQILISVNGLTEEPEKDRLIIVERAEGERYVVKPGDTFFELAGRDGEKAFALMNKNKTDELYAGQTIYI